MRSLIIGGIEIPIRAAHSLTQSYTHAQAVARLRMSNGDLVQQSSWSGKLNTSIDADGLMPAGIHELDFLQGITIKCVADRAVSSASNVITVPTARRADYGVEGKALVADIWQSTPVSMATDVATLTIVAGATLYQAIYWPELICFCDPPAETRNARSGDYGWTLTGEQL